MAPSHAGATARHLLAATFVGGALALAAAAQAGRSAQLERELASERSRGAALASVLADEAQEARTQRESLEQDLGAVEDEADRLYGVVEAMYTLGEQVRVRVGLNEPVVEPLPALPPRRERPMGGLPEEPGASQPQSAASILAAGSPRGRGIVATLPPDSGPWTPEQLRAETPGGTGVAHLLVVSDAITRRWEQWQRLGSAVDAALDRRTRAVRPTIRPAAGPITSWFGRRPGFWGALAYHSGIDISVPIGTPVAVTANGTVSYTGWRPDYGVTVEVQHGDGMMTLYGHLTRAIVRAGQAVEQGQVVALSGNTGASTGPHVHYEVRLNGSAVDPSRYWE